jgi:hypothetical protein
MPMLIVVAAGVLVHVVAALAGADAGAEAGADAAVDAAADGAVEAAVAAAEAAGLAPEPLHALTMSTAAATRLPIRNFVPVRITFTSPPKRPYAGRR